MSQSENPQNQQIRNDASASNPTGQSQETAVQERSAKIAVTVFPLLVIAGAAVAVINPEPFRGWAPQVTLLLQIIMFGMGLTLTLGDFSYVFKRPLPILIGVVAQFVIMPLLGLGIAVALQLPPELAAGVILVGCAPGGTSSNVVTYLAKGDTALSVTMTSISTLFAPIMTPLLTLWLAGSYMPVDAGSMAWSIVQIVLIPVVGGLVIRLLLPKLVEAILPILPWVSVLAITAVVIAVIPGSHNALMTAGGLVFVAVILHNLAGYGLGYAAGRLTRRSDKQSRTVAIEVGMQNSGLAAGLAAQYFSPEAALPAAIFSTWHNISGALFAAVSRRFPPKDRVVEPAPESVVS
nr:bile acid:sodium symporter family protein [Actinomycetales bacterium]